MRYKTFQAAQERSKKCKQAPNEVTECSATYYEATCTEDDGDGWLQFDHCDTWVCSKRSCERFLVDHESDCDFRG